jgi:(4-(4-[2-(gamma-L-glutamylamino)ethyl]phenoxymethyl)furan-2-yl)methanamine synthase
MTPTSLSDACLGLDIGGANVKAAHSSGETRNLPLELWKDPTNLPRCLSQLCAAFPPFTRAAVTMTAELCDCYATKSDGVFDILHSVEVALGSRPVAVWGIDGQFHSPDEVRERPDLAMAANWLALATWAARLGPRERGVLIDVGSTTTDVIRLESGRPMPSGRTDTERLITGELVYAGVRRTPVCALATELPWRDGLIGLCGELFATTLDVYVTSGEIAADPADRLTADGRPSTIDAARDRLARMVGADPRAFSPADARDLAIAADKVLAARLAKSAARVLGTQSDARTIAIVSGSGEFLARRVATRILSAGASVFSLSDALGPSASVAACAYAVMKLASERES